MCRRRVRVLAAVPVFMAAVIAGAHCAQAAAANDPCRLLTRTDVFRLNGWNIARSERKRYDVQGASGAMCFLTSPQGVVVVTLPDPGAGFPGLTAFNDPQANGLALTVHGMGAEVVLYNGTAYISKRHRDASVRVVPNDHPASYQEVQPFAKPLIRRLR